jgi:hypothetical protein
VYLSIATGLSVETCSTEELTCVAMCSCDAIASNSSNIGSSNVETKISGARYSGVACDVSAEEREARRELRCSLLAAHNQLVAMVNPSLSTLQSWTTTLNSLSQVLHYYLSHAIRYPARLKLLLSLTLTLATTFLYPLALTLSLRSARPNAPLLYYYYQTEW